MPSAQSFASIGWPSRLWCCLPHWAPPRLLRTCQNRSHARQQTSHRRHGNRRGSKDRLALQSRVDTGATTSSLHVEDYVIEDEAEEMADNVGRKIRFRMKNHDGESEWLESKIAKSLRRQNLGRSRRAL